MEVPLWYCGGTVLVPRQGWTPDGWPWIMSTLAGILNYGSCTDMKWQYVLNVFMKEEKEEYTEIFKENYDFMIVIMFNCS